MLKHNTRHRLRAEARRDSIIDAAIRLFSERGFKGTTTRELSAAVGVTEPVLYEHFRTKHELYDAMMERIAEQGMDSFGAMLESSRSANLHGRVRAVAHAIVGWFVLHPAFIRLLLFSALEGEDLSRKFIDRASGRVVDTIASYVKSDGRGLRQDLDIEAVGYTLFCMMVQHGLAHVLFDEAGADVQHELVDRMVDVVISGMTK
jgi:AcrR family transcriptional regulator